MSMGRFHHQPHFGASNMCKIKITRREGSFFEDQIYCTRRFERGFIRIWTECFRHHKADIRNLQNSQMHLPLVKLCLKNFSGQEKLVTQLGKHHFLTTCLQFSCDLALLGGPLSITHKWVEHHMGTALVPNLSYTKALPKREKRKKKKATFLSFLSRGTIGNHLSTPIKGRDKVCVHYTYVTKRQYFYPFGAETP